VLFPALLFWRFSGGSRAVRGVTVQPVLFPGAFPGAPAGRLGSRRTAGSGAALLLKVYVICRNGGFPYRFPLLGNGLLGAPVIVLVIPNIPAVVVVIVGVKAKILPRRGR